MDPCSRVSTAPKPPCSAKELSLSACGIRKLRCDSKLQGLRMSNGIFGDHSIAQGALKCVPQSRVNCFMQRLYGTFQSEPRLPCKQRFTPASRRPRVPTQLSPAAVSVCGQSDMLTLSSSGTAVKGETAVAVRPFQTLLEAVNAGAVQQWGALQTLDAEMCVPNETSWEKVIESGPEWAEAINTVLGFFQQVFGDRLVSVYVRGSVPRGLAIAGVSDLDMLAYVLGSPSTPAASSVARVATDELDWAVKVHSLKAEAAKRFPFLTGVEMRVVEVDPNSEVGTVIINALSHSSLSSDPTPRSVNLYSNGTSTSSSRSSQLSQPKLSSTSPIFLRAQEQLPLGFPFAFVVKSQSLRVWGLDIHSLLPPEVARPESRARPALRDALKQAIGYGQECQEMGDQKAAGAAYKWALKRCIRAGFECAMEVDGWTVYTQDLYWCCHVAAQHRPNLEPNLVQALILCLQEPAAVAASREEVNKCIQVLGSAFSAPLVEPTVRVPLVEFDAQTERNTVHTERNASHTERNTSQPERNTSQAERNASQTGRNASQTGRNSGFCERSGTERNSSKWDGTELRRRDGLSETHPGWSLSMTEPLAESSWKKESQPGSSVPRTNHRADLGRSSGKKEKVRMGPRLVRPESSTWQDAICHVTLKFLGRSDLEAGCAAAALPQFQGAIRGAVAECEWGTSQGRESGRRAVRLILQGAREAQPVILRGAGSAHPALRKWSLDFLAANSDLSGLVRVSPNFKFMYCEESHLDVRSGLVAAPSRTARMSVQEFALRSQAQLPMWAKSLCREYFWRRERYYMQAFLPEALLQDLRKDLPPFAIPTEPAAHSPFTVKLTSSEFAFEAGAITGRQPNGFNQQLSTLAEVPDRDARIGHTEQELDGDVTSGRQQNSSDVGRTRMNGNRRGFSIGRGNVLFNGQERKIRNPGGSHRAEIAGGAECEAGREARDVIEGQAWRLSQEPRLWMSPRGAVSPLHFDASPSCLLQVRGRKRMLLYESRDLAALYPHPNDHPLRRRARVDPTAPDLSSFPAFADVAAVEAILHPGDVIFFPSRWAHYTESQDFSISVSCRFFEKTQ